MRGLSLRAGRCTKQGSARLARSLPPILPSRSLLAIPGVAPSVFVEPPFNQNKTGKRSRLSLVPSAKRDESNGWEGASNARRRTSSLVGARLSRFPYMSLSCPVSLPLVEVASLNGILPAPSWSCFVQTREPASPPSPFLGPLPVPRREASSLQCHIQPQSLFFLPTPPHMPP